MRLNKIGEWGDQYEVETFPLVYGINVFVLNCTESSCCTTYGELKLHQQQCKLLYCGYHYDLLEVKVSKKRKLSANEHIKTVSKR